MKKILIIAGLLLTSTVFANSRGEYVGNILRLASRIQNIAQDTDLSNQELRDVQRDLSDIVKKLNGRGSSNNCLEFAIEVYETTYSSASALRYAREACKRITDIELVQFVYEIYVQSYTPKYSFERAIDKTENQNFRGKSELLELVYSAYIKSYTPTYSIERSLDKVAEMPRNSFSCVEISYRTYLGSYTPTYSIERALDDCK
ncbi:hypothetical protein BIY24_08090 [Halobacteriovorax marinus]|uniref:Hypothetical exported protein n=1 Tax=Halobacteriovorax marinus (strain ATCC BAA-682 / DSM 15412 / SJ) TaxID=862908 RepID=E1X1G2_HALMS|nr:hypothetical protein [Halobacteriovorax marinus]ATH07910.1 hypothetical protein BIY24_08090 [Halobacteriovorax marinus]CBW26553.1 hypothetical exported protein [Halobacteriovorax marinus SJ]